LFLVVGIERLGDKKAQRMCSTGFWKQKLQTELSTGVANQWTMDNGQWKIDNRQSVYDSQKVSLICILKCF